VIIFTMTKSKRWRSAWGHIYGDQ